MDDELESRNEQVLCITGLSVLGSLCSMRSSPLLPLPLRGRNNNGPIPQSHHPVTPVAYCNFRANQQQQWSKRFGCLSVWRRQHWNEMKSGKENKRFMSISRTFNPSIEIDNKYFDTVARSLARSAACCQEKRTRLKAQGSQRTKQSIHTQRGAGLSQCVHTHNTTTTAVHTVEAMQSKAKQEARGYKYIGNQKGVALRHYNNNNNNNKKRFDVLDVSFYPLEEVEEEDKESSSAAGMEIAKYCPPIIGLEQCNAMQCNAARALDDTWRCKLMGKWRVREDNGTGRGRAWSQSQDAIVSLTISHNYSILFHSVVLCSLYGTEKS